MTTRLPVIIFALFCALVIPEAVQAQRGSYAAVSAGEYHGLVLKKDGTLWAFGNNDSGEIGDGTRRKRPTPVKVLSEVRQMAAGGQHSMAITDDGSLYAWGDNSKGQLGDGTTANRLKPVKVLSDVK